MLVEVLPYMQIDILFLSYHVPGFVQIVKPEVATLLALRFKKFVRTNHPDVLAWTDGERTREPSNDCAMITQASLHLAY